MARCFHLARGKACEECIMDGCTNVKKGKKVLNDLNCSILNKYIYRETNLYEACKFLGVIF
jgi:hypothetical protein